MILENESINQKEKEGLKEQQEEGERLKDQKQEGENRLSTSPYFNKWILKFFIF